MANANRLPTPSPPATPPAERATRMRHCGWDSEPPAGSYPSGEHIEIHPPEVVVQTSVHHPHLVSEVSVKWPISFILLYLHIHLTIDMQLPVKSAHGSF